MWISNFDWLHPETDLDPRLPLADCIPYFFGNQQRMHTLIEDSDKFSSIMDDGSVMSWTCHIDVSFCPPEA